MLRSRLSKAPALALTLAFCLRLATGGATARAQEPPRPSAPPQTSLSLRGGVLAKTARHQFEVFFYKTGIRVFPRDADEKPLGVASMTGTGSFSLPGAPSPFVYQLRGAAPGNAAPSSSLDLGVDLSKVPAAGTSVTFEIKGLADPAEPTATFTVPFALTGGAASTTPARAVPATLTITRSTAADQAAINAQRVCKVSGESLGSMGAPIKVTRGDRVIFLCCQGCVRRIQANPDQYLGRG
jgi:hypothetical protein